MVNDNPLTPGPRDIDGPLSIRLASEAGTVGTIQLVEIDSPTPAELAAIAATPEPTDE
jgi:hypothetical protein